AIGSRHTIRHDGRAGSRLRSVARSVGAGPCVRRSLWRRVPSRDVADQLRSRAPARIRQLVGGRAASEANMFLVALIVGAAIGYAMTRDPLGVVALALAFPVGAFAAQALIGMRSVRRGKSLVPVDI